MEEEKVLKETVTDDLTIWGALKIVFVEYFLSTTSHALPNIFRTSNVLLKIIWLCCFLASTAYCMKSMIVSLQDFLEYPSYISTSLVQELPAPFPAVTICNLKTINKYAATSYFTAKLNSTSVNQSFFSSPLEYILNLQYTFKTILVTDTALTTDSRKDFGYILESMLISCFFNYKACTAADFTYFFDPLFGNCYTFNKGVDNNGTKTKVKKVTIDGAYYGLQLELFLGGPLEIETFGEYNDGLLVSLHNQSIKPFTRSLITVPTGSLTNLAVTRHFITKLEKPHGDCFNDVSKTSKFSSPLFDYIVRTLDLEYSHNHCFSLCIQRQIKRECNCSNLYLPFLSESNINFCLDKESGLCLSNVVEKFDEKVDVIKECKNDCPFECESIDYELTTSRSFFPTKYYRELLFNTTIIKDSGIAIEDLHEAVAKVNIYYNSMEYKRTEQRIKTSTEDFFSNIGGTLGLYIGISLLSVIELVELLINITIALLTIRKKQKQVNNIPIST